MSTGNNIVIMINIIIIKNTFKWWNAAEAVTNRHNGIRKHKVGQICSAALRSGTIIGESLRGGTFYQSHQLGVEMDQTFEVVRIVQAGF